MFVPIDKKGNRDQTDKHRGLSLISVICKCYTYLQNTRLYTWLKEKCSTVKHQAGVRKNYFTTDQIFNLYAVIQKCLDKKVQKLYAAFVDFKKDFDSVHHNTLLEVVYNERFERKMFRALKSMYNSLLSCVRINNGCDGFFQYPIGVRQGCVMSPTLFSLFINQLANQ